VGAIASNTSARQTDIRKIFDRICASPLIVVDNSPWLLKKSGFPKSASKWVTRIVSAVGENRL